MIVNANLFKFLPKTEYAENFLRTGQLEFKDPYREYPKESNIFFGSRTRFFRLENLFVSCFSTNNTGYLDKTLWKKFGGNGEGVCLGFLDNSTSAGSYSFYERDGIRVCGIYCQYPKAPWKNGIEKIESRKEFTSTEEEIFYFVTKRRSQLHEHEKRYFLQANKEESRIMTHFGVDHFLYFNAIIFGEMVPSKKRDALLSLCPPGFQFNKSFLIGRQKSRLTLFST